jgi:hypothetical protein
VLDEFLNDVEVNVGFEHGDADLFESLVHVFFAKGSLASEGFEGPLQLLCKVLKHIVRFKCTEKDV